MPQDMVDAVDVYSITERTTRSEAFRRLIQLGLKARATGLIW
ncbi:ribbon-helix-helix protein, CopG family [Bradyrhizobium sp. WSM1417]